MIDFEEIAEHLPKPTLEWDCNDVVTWLEINNLSAVSSKFKTLKVDGRAFASMNQSFIVNELKVSSLAYLKKLVEWVEMGREDYDHFLKEYLEDNPAPKSTPFLKDSQDNVKFVESSLFIASKQESQSGGALLRKLLLSINSKEYLVESNSKMGRATNNQIVIPDDAISRLHAEILINESEEYFIKDCSRFGTYIKLDQRFEIYEKLHLIVGGTQMVVTRLKVTKGGFELVINTPEPKEATHSFCNKSTINIGKKYKDVSVYDEAMANHHCRITLEEEKVVLESLEGSCFRKLSEGETVRLDNTTIKMGNTLILCQLVQECIHCKSILKQSQQHHCLSA